MKSTFSNSQGNCVDVAWRISEQVIEVRDTKLGEDSPVLRFTLDEWDAFLLGVADGQFGLDVMEVKV